MEEAELKQKIAELTIQVRSAPICDSSEGAVIHLVDRESNQVIGMAKIKSIEY